MEVKILRLEVQLDRKTQQYVFSGTNKSGENLRPDIGLATDFLSPWKILWPQENFSVLCRFGVLQPHPLPLPPQRKP